MQQTRLGNTGLSVSRICLGMMTYGTPAWRPWVLDEAASRPLVQRAVELGITFFDTADMYSGGESEVLTGKFLREFCQRDEIVIATKLFHPVDLAFKSGSAPRPPGTDRPNLSGLSRKRVFHAIDASLKRLGTDYVDLYQIHRWDRTTPIEETLEALHDIVKAGKARYIGASSMWVWQFAKALYTADAHGWTRFVSMQDHYNLLQREEEREMLSLCADQGIGVIPWSPLARGRLTRDWDEQTARSETDEFGETLYRPEDRQIVERVAEVAAERGVPRAQIALAWVLRNPVVTAPIVGAGKISHLEDAVAAVELRLGDDEVTRLEEPYTSREPAGF
ncbi:MAG TPA: aldo/keto reductase [Candidatus Solibacter sp.]|nr:aldo/keto reductase [Candidatus Solibacter sp.]